MATTNPWKRFIGLLPGDVRTVATVRSIDSTSGISEVELRTGTRITVRGIDVPVSSKAYIADGTITGPAPELPHFDVEV
ncbi:hypothetical protein [Stutzerimonas stutzeri]|uniref:hypothetical protein n=1 Tax=Stutzerimonas stutzeri TaxID=316 RepID=UPI000F79D011|nr:hypothetical protein [Stutzerimonas stutzeri]MCP3432985.1 hypothetical protein [Stutzerimonas stutzeri]RRV61035.1 hypothetical protein EGJ08_05275 [Stutzerimonas stutzeri]RTM25052.1 hypothetical protein EKN22_04960 [Stutzerimonas stutzeri]